MLKNILLICLAAFTNSSLSQSEIYYDQFNWGFVSGSPGNLNTAFWAGPRDSFSYEPQAQVDGSGGAARVSNNQFFSQLGSAELGIRDFEFYSRIRMTSFSDDPDERNAEIAFRSDGGEGFMVTLDGGQDLIRLRRQGGGFGDLTPPAEIPIAPGDSFYLHVQVQGEEPAVITTRVASDPAFTEESTLFSVEHKESEWLPGGTEIRLIGFTLGGPYAFDFDYFSIGEIGFDHPVSAWTRDFFTDAPPLPEVSRPERLDDYQLTDQSITLFTGDSAVRLTSLVEGAFLTEYAPDGDFGSMPESFAVTRNDWPALPALSVSDQRDEPLLIEGPGWRVAAERDPFRLSFFAENGELLFGEAPGRPMLAADQTRSVTFTLQPEEPVYGLGQHSIFSGANLDRRGQTFLIENEHQPPSRLLFPFWISSKGYGVFVDNPANAVVDIGFSSANELTYSTANGGPLRYYVYAGDSIYGALDLHTQVTGRPALAPRWTLGNIQSKYGYQSFDEIQSIIDGFRSRELPLDSIVIDLYWFGIETMGNLEFQNTPAWANPAERLAGFREQGIKIIPITEPHITGLSFNQPELEANGFLGQRPEGGAYGFNLSWVTNQAPVYLFDFTNPDAREWWKQKHQRLIQTYGFDGFWQDLNEPEAEPGDIVYTAGAGAQVGNAIAINMNRTLDEAMERYRPGARTFIMSRSGYPGMQKYGASVWSGDVSASWFDLQKQPAVALGMGLAGAPYWNSDIGGFNGTPSPELYLRWCQFGLFSPLYRPHAANSDREPWRFGFNAELAVEEVLRLRYQLIPHYYTVARESYDSGAPIMRPLVVEFPDDPAVRDRAMPFLYGKNLLANPVLQEGADSVDIYFPRGRWRQLQSRRIETGPAQRAVTVNERTIPVYQREGSVIPTGPFMETSDEAPLEEVRLIVFPAITGKASGELYEDDGLTRAYETGAFARTSFTVQRGRDYTELTISEVSGAFDGLVSEREWFIEFVLPIRPNRIQEVGEDFSIPRIVNGNIQSAEQGWIYDDSISAVLIKLSRKPVSQERVIQIEHDYLFEGLLIQ